MVFFESLGVKCIVKILFFHEWKMIGKGSQDILYEYLGPNLAPRTEYTWSVIVTDNHGETSEGTSRFETGLLNGSAFEGKAQWITHAPDKASPRQPGVV